MERNQDFRGRDLGRFEIREAQIFLKRILEGAMEDEVMEYIGISRKYEICF